MPFAFFAPFIASPQSAMIVPIIAEMFRFATQKLALGASFFLLAYRTAV